MAQNRREQDTVVAGGQRRARRAACHQAWTSRVGTGGRGEGRISADRREAASHSPAGETRTSTRPPWTAPGASAPGQTLQFPSSPHAQDHWQDVPGFDVRDVRIRGGYTKRETSGRVYGERKQSNRRKPSWGRARSRGSWGAQLGCGVGATAQRWRGPGGTSRAPPRSDTEWGPLVPHCKDSEDGGPEPGLPRPSCTTSSEGHAPSSRPHIPSGSPHLLVLKGACLYFQIFLIGHSCFSDSHLSQMYLCLSYLLSQKRLHDCIYPERHLPSQAHQAPVFPPTDLAEATQKTYPGALLRRMWEPFFRAHFYFFLLIVG